MRRYRAFGLAIDSPIALGSPAAGDIEADVTIAMRPIADRIACPSWEAVCVQASPDEVLLRLPGRARILVRRGCEILVDGGDLAPTELPMFLSGPALAALLCQRGVAVLHGTAIEAATGAALLLGQVATGKSSTAAVLGQRGFRQVSDGLCAIALHDGRPMAMPGDGKLRLWRAAAHALGIDLSGVEPERPGIDRFAVPSAQVEAPIPVTRLLRLVTPHAGLPPAEPIAGTQRMAALLDSDHNARNLGGTGGRGSSAAMLALAALPATMLRPARRDDPFARADLVEAALA